MCIYRSFFYPLIAALLLALPAVVLAQQQPPRPSVFGGTASIDGVPAPNGTLVIAMIDGKEVASTTVTAGGYALVIDQPAGESFAGKVIFFMVGKATARETATWQYSGGGVLNLTATTPERRLQEEQDRLERDRLERERARQEEQERIQQEQERIELEFSQREEQLRREVELLEFERQRREQEQRPPGEEGPPSGGDPPSRGPTRGFFTNSPVGQLGSVINLIEPTTLAVLGILLSLGAAMLQLFRGR